MRALQLLILIPFSSGFVPAPNCNDRHSCLLSTTVSVEDFFGDELKQELAAEIASTINLPFVPSPMVKYISAQAIGKISTNISNDSMQRLQELLQTQATKSTLDDLSEAEVNALADQIAKELNPTIDVPVLEEEQELLVLQQVMRAVFATLTTSNKAQRKYLINSSLGVSKDLLGSKSSRKSLVSTITAAVDVPILDEKQEESLIELAVETCSGTLRSALPPDVIETLKGESPENIAKMKSFVIQTINEKVDVVGLSEEQERQLIEIMVNVLIDQYVSDTDAEFLLLTEKEQLEVLRKQKEARKNKKVLSQRRFEREQLNLDARLDRTKKRIKEIKRSRSIVRRIFRKGKK